MKIIMIECTAEELEANKTIADSITEVLSKITRRLVGVDLDNAQAVEILKKMNKEEETEEESETEE